MGRILSLRALLLLSAALTLGSWPTLAAAAASSTPAPTATPAASTKPDLETRADAGDAAAALKYAVPLLAAGKSAADQAIGLKSLRQAADAKIADADTRLGDAYRTGSFGLAIAERSSGGHRPRPRGPEPGWSATGPIR